MTMIIRRPQAEIDLVELWRYIAADDTDAADRLVDRINARMLELAVCPFSGRSRDDLYPRLRSVPVGNWVVFYMVDEVQVDIVRILHGARDIEGQNWGTVPPDPTEIDK